MIVAERGDIAIEATWKTVDAGRVKRIWSITVEIQCHSKEQIAIGKVTFYEKQQYT